VSEYRVSVIVSWSATLNGQIVCNGVGEWDGVWQNEPKADYLVLPSKHDEGQPLFRLTVDSISPKERTVDLRDGAVVTACLYTIKCRAMQFDLDTALGATLMAKFTEALNDNRFSVSAKMTRECKERMDELTCNAGSKSNGAVRFTHHANGM